MTLKLTGLIKHKEKKTDLICQNVTTIKMAVANPNREKTSNGY